MTLRTAQRRPTARQFPLIFPRPGCLPGSPPLFRRPPLTCRRICRPDRSRTHLCRGRQSSANTRRAYASDWKHFSAWCRASESVSPPAGSGSRWSVHHSLCFRGGRARRETQQRFDHRAAPGCHRLELYPARHDARSQGSRHRHRHGRHSQHPRRAAVGRKKRYCRKT
jgi:hypothetical protein